jgi:hypothetical protein
MDLLSCEAGAMKASVLLKLSFPEFFGFCFLQSWSVAFFIAGTSVPSVAFVPFSLFLAQPRNAQNSKIIAKFSLFWFLVPVLRDCKLALVIWSSLKKEWDKCDRWDGCGAFGSERGSCKLAVCAVLFAKQNEFSPNEPLTTDN